MTLTWCSLACFALLAACAPDVERVTPSQDRASVGVVEQGLREPKDAYTCARDEDCTATCKWGALNAAWAKKHLDGVADCYDGCEPLRPLVCDRGVCAIMLRGGKKRYHACTLRSVDDVLEANDASAVHPPAAGRSDL